MTLYHWLKLSVTWVFVGRRHVKQILDETIHPLGVEAMKINVRMTIADHWSTRKCYKMCDERIKYLEKVHDDL